MLRPPTEADLPYLHLIGSDAASNELAGTKPRSYDVFMARWKEVLRDPAITSRVILAGEAGREGMVGSISVFKQEADDAIGYWIDRAHWRRGIASRAVGLMLNEVRTRPLYATAAANNAASLRILSSHGFREVSREYSPETDRYLARLTVKLMLS